MEALILSCSTGGGHNAAGYAVKEELERRGWRVTFFDPYDLIDRNLSDKVGDSYIKLVQKSPQTFGFVYALGEAYRHLPVHSPVYWANGKASASMQNYLMEHQFDAIFMTHMYPAHILSNIKEQIQLPPTCLIATDYTCIPFMEETVCDYYVIPSEELTEEFSSRGIPKEKILPFGIPVKSEFAGETDKSQLRKQYGWDMEKRYLLLSGGSIGAGEIEKTAKILARYLQAHPDCFLEIICGNNRRLFETLSQKYAKNSQISILTRTEHMAEYMKACDVFITKPGGLSSTEAAVAEIPLIHISPIPGCETKNKDFFAGHEMALAVTNLEKELLPALEKLEDAAVCEKMRAAQRRFINQRAAGMLCDFMERRLPGFCAAQGTQEAGAADCE